MASSRPELQKARLRLFAVALVAALGCADLRARLVESSESPRARSAQVPATWVRYVVQPGDTLGHIATCRGTSVAALARANRLAAPDRLVAGSVLRVPGSDGCPGPALARSRPLPPEEAGVGAGPALNRVVADLLARATARYDGADFEEALALAETGISALASHPRGAETDGLRARCHTVAGMAAAGLGQRERAIAEFRRGLAFGPELPLDPERSSPRVLELVEEARADSTANEAPYEPFVESSTR